MGTENLPDNPLADQADTKLAADYRAAEERESSLREELERRGWSVDRRSTPAKIERTKTKKETL